MKAALLIKKLAILGIVCAPVPVTYVAHDKIKAGIEHVRHPHRAKRIGSAVRRQSPPPCEPTLAGPLSVPLHSIPQDFGGYYDLPTSAQYGRPQTYWPQNSQEPGFVVTRRPIVIPEPGNSIPEPATWTLLISGFALVGIALRSEKVTYDRPAH